MIARQHPSFSRAEIFPSFSQASNCFITFNFGPAFPPFIREVIPDRKAGQPQTPLYTGYRFDGWFQDAAFTAPWDFNSTVGGDNFTLYAKWTAIVYDISYYLNGGINHPDNPATYTVEDPDIVLEKPTKYNDEFFSWYKDVMFSIPVKIINTRNAMNISVYARFVEKRETVFTARETDTDRFGGDPKLYLTQNGAELRYAAGQPVMERGLENQVLISLFTKKGWAGNVFLPPENRIGSGFEETCSGSITLAKLNDIADAAEKALVSKAFQGVNIEVKNPRSDNVMVRATVASGGELSFSREGALWRNQREQS